MYSYYLKRTFVVTNVEKLTGFFFYRTLKIFKHVQPTIQTAHTVSELLVYKPSEKLKVILSVSSPSSNPEEDSLFSCVSSPTCRCSVWPKAAPATEHLPLPFPSSSPPPSPVTDMEPAVTWEIYAQAAASGFSLDADPRESLLGSMSLALLPWGII